MSHKNDGLGMATFFTSNPRARIGDIAQEAADPFALTAASGTVNELDVHPAPFLAVPKSGRRDAGQPGGLSSFPDGVPASTRNGPAC